jgi:Ca2+-transporting ATPase
MSASSLIRPPLIVVEEFRQAVGFISVTDLKHSLKIHRRVGFSSTEEQREASIGVLYLLTTHFSQFVDWKELVQEGAQDDVEDLMKEFLPNMKKAKMPATSLKLLPPPSLYFDRRVERVLDMFRVDIDNGLSSSRITELLEHYGANVLPPPPKPSVLKMAWTQITDFMVLILLTAGIISAALGDPKSAAVLFVVIVLNVVIGFVQEFKANRAMEALLTLTVMKVMKSGILAFLAAVF